MELLTKEWKMVKDWGLYHFYLNLDKGQSKYSQELKNIINLGSIGSTNRLVKGGAPIRDIALSNYILKGSLVSGE
jgi:hypothetical protein